MFSIKSYVYNIRGKQKLQQPVYNFVKFGKNRFSYHGAKLWNILPDLLREKEMYVDFKYMLKGWESLNCSCSYCDIPYAF